MSSLDTWVETPLAQAVGWTLLHSLWEGAIVAATLAAALVALRSARARYAAACIAMLVMLGGIGLTLFRVMPEGVHDLHAVGRPAFPVWNAPTGMAATGPLGPRLTAIIPWLTPFWLVGVWIFAFRQVAGWISVCRLRRRGVCCAPEGWQEKLAGLGAQVRVSRPIMLLESCLADVPMVVGHLRPAILMPIGLLAGLPVGQIEAILMHELAHIRRYDYLVNMLQRSAECLFFYHPAAWWISRVIRAERENCCDDVVVATSGNAQEYAFALAALEQNRWPGRQAAVAGTGGSLVKRIRRLLYPQGANGAWTPFLAAAILVATAAVAFAAWPVEPSQQSSAASLPQQKAPLVPGSVHLKPFPTQPLAHFVMHADSRHVFESLARLGHFNVAFTYDFEDQPITVDLTNVTIEEALQALCLQTKSFWKPVSSGTVLVMPDNQINRRKYTDLVEPSAFDRWLKEEVVYIISDEERAAFQKLTTDEEREKFVYQFWERRNPNPGSPENEFKKEFYRRIAYANEHFASANPGWKTDRGHMYIIYGPPDELDDHDAGPPYAFEEWKYRYIDGLGANVTFTFIDPARDGEFRLAPGPPVMKKPASP
jgi:GWxTD domain-containing protein